MKRESMTLEEALEVTKQVVTEGKEANSYFVEKGGGAVDVYRYTLGDKCVEYFDHPALTIVQIKSGNKVYNYDADHTELPIETEITMLVMKKMRS